jgi:hypothetical protein
MVTGLSKCSFCVIDGPSQNIRSMKFQSPPEEGIPPGAPVLVKANVAQIIIGVGPSTLWHLKKTGKLRYVAITPRKHLFNLDDLYAFVNARTVG